MKIFDDIKIIPKRSKIYILKKYAPFKKIYMFTNLPKFQVHLKKNPLISPNFSKLL